MTTMILPKAALAARGAAQLSELSARQDKDLIVPTGEEQHFVNIPIETLDISRLKDGVTITSGPTRGTLTALKAANFLKLPKFEGERPFRKTWLATLIAEVEQGTFRPESVQIVTCTISGRKSTYRMNGQHTAWMVLNMARRQTDFALLGIEFIQYEAKNEDYMRSLYATIDAGAPRSQGNKLISLLAGTPQLATIGSDIIRRLGEGIAFLKWPTHRGVHDAKHRAHLMTTDFVKESRMIGEFLRKGRSSESHHMLRASVIAAMYATFSIAPGGGQRSAKTFWEGVCSGANLDEDDARMRLFKELITTAVADRGIGRDKKQVSREHMFRVCQYAWNSFRQGKKLKKPLRSFRFTNKERPEFI
jgi:hypothetical protein